MGWFNLGKEILENTFAPKELNRCEDEWMDGYHTGAGTFDEHDDVDGGNAATGESIDWFGSDNDGGSFSHDSDDD